MLKNSSIATKDGAGAYIKNESSIGVKVTVKMNITDDNDTKVTPVATLDDVTKDDKTNICLLAIPSSNSPSGIDKYEASDQGIVIMSTDSTAATEFSFVLDPASYSIKKDADGTLSYAKDAGDTNFDAASFKLGGKANGKADWAAYTGTSKKNIGVNAVFSVADAGENDTAKDDPAYTAHGLMELASTVKTVKVEPATAAPSIANKNVTLSKANGANITVDLGKGDKKATGVAKVGVVVNGTEYPWETSVYEFAGTTLKIKANSPIAGLDVGATRTVRVTFNDAAKTYVDTTFTLAN